jgi:hypothetical protein
MSPHAAAAGVDLDAEQTAAIDAPRAGGTVAITGTAGTGKTFTLVRRALRLAAEANPDAILVSAPSDAGVARLRALLRARDAGPAIVCASLGDIALDVLRAIRGPGAQIEAIDDVRASRHFEQAGAQLFSLEWTELVSAEIDPEITGMRTPERFSAAAYRLIRSACAGPRRSTANRRIWRARICCSRRLRSIAIRCAPVPKNSNGNVCAKSISSRY